MAVRQVSTKLTLDGEKEFKSQMSSVNSALREIRSEMSLSEATFKGQANTVEALTDKQRLLQKAIEQQEEKVRALTQASEDAEQAFEGNEKKVDDYRISLNKAKEELVKMQRELDDTSKYLEEAEDSLDGVSDSLDEFGKERETGSFLDDLKGGLGDLQGLLTGGLIAGGVTEVTSAIFNLEESTREYRQIMGQLEVSAAAAGYTAEETSAAYDYLFGVLGDTQSTATTIANLQATGAKQKELTKLIDACTGAWSKYGDSIPIDGLSEAINETVRTGEVTGVLADVINWGTDELENFGVALKEDTEENEAFNKAVQDATTKEDLFNIALGEGTTEADRLKIIMDALSKQGLPDLGQAYRDTNEDIIAVNEAQNTLDKQLGRMGEMVAPAVSALKEGLGKTLEGVLDGFENLIQKTREWGQQAPTIREMLGLAEETNKVGVNTFEASVSAAEEKARANLASPIMQTNVPKTVEDLSTATKSAFAAARTGGGMINLISQTVVDGEVVYEKQEELSIRNGKAVGK